MSDEAATSAIQAALVAGLTYFDTAPHYGFGLSERRLGAVLPASAMISTKVGRVLEPIAEAAAIERHGFVGAEPFEPRFDYTYDGVMRSFEASLSRLRRDKVAILLVHDLGVAVHGPDHPQRLREFLDGGYRAMAGLRDSGAVGAIGLGVNESEAAEELLGHVDLDVVLLAGRYSLLEQGPLQRFLPLCTARDVAVIVGGPFNSGALVENPDGIVHYNYAPASRAVRDMVEALRAACARHGVPLGAAALQFCMAHPQVASVIPGLANPAQVEEAVAWRDIAIPPALWDELRDGGLISAGAPTPDLAGRS
jgi:D-threo-aldose 1-dehydrogenase